MPQICIEVPGEPVAKGRPRFTTMGGFARAYTDKKTLNYESLVTLSALSSGLVPDKPLECPITVDIVAVHERTKELCKTSKKGIYKYPTSRIPKLTRLDADNCAKSILDGLNRASIWKDDSYVWQLSVQKVFAAIGENPHCEVVITWDD
jgi:Holliday junction resolvase RusA-like endonuclease